MLDTLISGKLIKQPELKTSKNGSQYTPFMLSVSTGDTENILVSGVAFGSVAERITQLTKGDALAVTGALKPTEWQDKTTGETRHGLSVTVSGVLSVYDISKKRKTETNTTQQDNPSYGNNPMPYDDALGF